MANDDNSIVRKIAALLAKAEGTSNVYEAEVFMAKVNELLEKHQIEMHRVREAGGDNDPMNTHEEFVTRSHEWPTRVGFALAEYYGCKMLRWKAGSRYLIRVLGRKSATETFKVMYPFVLSQVRQRARGMCATYSITPAKAERQIGIALRDRIYRLVPQQEQRRADLTANALVPVTDVQAYLDKLYPETNTVKALKTGISDVARKEAEKVSLNHQATAVGRKQLTANQEN